MHEMLNTLYETHPELDTQLHKDLYEESVSVEQTEELSKVTFSEITQEAKQIEVHSDYAGDDDEKKNIQTTGEQLLEENHMYILSTGLEGNVVVLSNKDMQTITDMKHTIAGLRRGERIPCYMDKDTGVLVVAMSPKYDEEDIHHGERALSHRDTYKGVVLTRALAVEKNGKAVISSPYEFADEHIQSCNIVKKRETSVLDVSTQKLRQGQLAIMHDLGIIMLDEHVAAYSETINKKIWEGIVLAYGEETDFDKIEHGIATTFSNLYKLAYYNEEESGALFSYDMFVGEPEGLKDISYSAIERYRNLIDVNPQDYDTHTKILLSGDTVQLAIMAYRNEAGNTMLVMGQGHPAADRFFREHAPYGDLNFGKHEVLAELTGELSIDTEAVSQVQSPGELHQKGLPLKIKLVSQNTELGTNGKIHPMIDLNDLVTEMNNASGRKKSYTPKVTFSL